MLLPLDGPSLQTSVAVSTTTVQAKVGASPLSERKVVTIQPIDGVIYIGFVTPVSTSMGFYVAKRQIISLEASESQSIYMIAASGTVNVIVAERA